MIYKNIILKYNDETFRLNRLKEIVNELMETIPIDYVVMINCLEDEKGTLNIYWTEKPSLFYKTIINSIWMDHYEFHTNHIIIENDNEHLFCKCCNSSPQKEDPAIRNYINNLN